MFHQSLLSCWAAILMYILSFSISIYFVLVEIVMETECKLGAWTPPSGCHILSQSGSIMSPRGSNSALCIFKQWINTHLNALCSVLWALTSCFNMASKPATTDVPLALSLPNHAEKTKRVQEVFGVMLCTCLYLWNWVRKNVAILASASFLNQCPDSSDCSQPPQQTKCTLASNYWDICHFLGKKHIVARQSDVSFSFTDGSICLSICRILLKENTKLLLWTPKFSWERVAQFKKCWRIHHSLQNYNTWFLMKLIVSLNGGHFGPGTKKLEHYAMCSLLTSTCCWCRWLFPNKCSQTWCILTQKW